MCNLITILLSCCAIHLVDSYYFFNAKTNQVISSGRLDVPKDFRIISPPKTLKTNKGKFTSGLYCQDMGFNCIKKFNYSMTYQFECDNDSQCPTSFICCPQKCFAHRVCSKGSTKPISLKTKEIGITPKPNIDQCEKFPYNCKTPYPSYLTYMYKCNFDKQCPNGYKCCAQDCFEHKICSRIERKVEKLDSKIQFDKFNHKVVSGTPKPNSNKVVPDITKRVDLIHEDITGKGKIEESNRNKKSKELQASEIDNNIDDDETQNVVHRTSNTDNDATTEILTSEEVTPDSNAIDGSYSELYEDYGEMNEDYYDEDDS